MQNEKPGPYRPPLKITDYQHVSSSRTFEITLDDGRCFTLVYTNNEDEEFADYGVRSLDIYDEDKGEDLDEDDDLYQQILEAAYNEGLG